MLKPIAILSTDTTHVEVLEQCWTIAAQSSFTLERPMLTLVLPGTGSHMEAAYGSSRALRYTRVGRVVFTPPDLEIRGRTHEGGRVRLVTCAFDRTYVARTVGALPNLSHSQLMRYLSIRSPLLPSLLTRLMNEALRPGFVSTALAESLGQAALLELWHLLLSDDGDVPRGRLTSRHFRIIDEYLAGLQYEAPSVFAIAHACGLSERYFAKLFREQTHQSIGRYLRSVQIAKAQSYLLQTDLPLKDIAHRLGFSAASNFSVAFRAATGDTPARFRTTNRRDIQKHPGSQRLVSSEALANVRSRLRSN